MSTIGLCMIVKNEAKVILACLTSVLPLVDYVLIIDTGSEDGTQEIIRDFLAAHNVPGAVIDEPWRDFAYNRTFALDRLREVETVDYAMIIDADDVLVADPAFDPIAFKSQMGQDLYDVELSQAGMSYYRPLICRNRLTFSFKGVLHEYLETPGPVTRETAKGFWVVSGRTGARSQNPRKYQDDAAVLEKALATETDPFLISRYTFYLAQSYKDCGEREKALGHYLRRAEQGFWIEEVYVSFLEAGNLMAALDRPFDEVVAIYERANQTVPARAEALHAVSLYCRNRERYPEGQDYARRGLDLTEPVGLFVQPWVYQYGLLDEFSVSAYWAGAYRESLDASLKLLASDKLPRDMLERVGSNARFAADKLPPEPSRSGGPGAERPIEQHNGAPTTPTTPAPLTKSSWVPERPAAGTELMVEGLRERLGEELDRINLQVNHPGHDSADLRPRVVWMHHNVDQQWVQWCKDRELVDTVHCFVFVSHWQREQYLAAFRLPPHRCVVLRHALDLSTDPRRWETRSTWRCAYTSTPFRGLSVLLDAWQRLSPANAELHIWSSMKLYLGDDSPYQHLYDRAQSMPGVSYHGLAPNSELRNALRTIDFLIYPCTFAETACLAAIEAMAAGCRIIVPSLGALPETTAGYARVYPFNPNAQEHAVTFSENLADELETPWGGQPGLSLSQQAHCAAVYDWPQRLREWRQLIQRLTR
ncbi:glycosyltransferase [Mesorhizobium sp. M00.F.Ca.ET.186.01.1.1]|nr:glycosyltransferase [bacterium M00.F.Ca.ET.152.01.1.1]TGV36133.1 glycosyltransferase [Mesorhizobium sp. M00.F.Ca.ET.186.01.1.1]TGZ43722.1 glycosyltransferase [bacterium M00.F.Ca.ET.162.01.1.1]